MLHWYILQVEGYVFKAGDIIRIVDDMGEVVKLQKGHGEWNDDMALVRTEHCVSCRTMLEIGSYVMKNVAPAGILAILCRRTTCIVCTGLRPGGTHSEEATPR